MMLVCLSDQRWNGAVAHCLQPSRTCDDTTSMPHRAKVQPKGAWWYFVKHQWRYQHQQVQFEGHFPSTGVHYSSLTAVEPSGNVQQSRRMQEARPPSSTRTGLKERNEKGHPFFNNNNSTHHPGKHCDDA
ncbi:unnamed protein product, partial [Ectocarpus fasciculatus]